MVCTPSTTAVARVPVSNSLRAAAARLAMPPYIPRTPSATATQITPIRRNVDPAMAPAPPENASTAPTAVNAKPPTKKKLSTPPRPATGNPLSSLAAGS